MPDTNDFISTFLTPASQRTTIFVPEEMKRRMLANQLLLKAASDTTQPVYTTGAGIAKLGAGALAGALQGWDNKQNDDANAAALAAALKAIGVSNPSAPQAQADAEQPANVPPSPAVATAQNAATAPQADTTGKIYNNNEPSPLDPPQGADRTKMMATILGEENTPQGQSGVANVIRNRAVDGGYGGDTPSAVVQAPKQFEPWSTDAGRARMAAALKDPKQVAAADKAIADAYGEGGRAPNDPTEGKLMFYAPQAQAALGRPAPSWAQGEGQKLGNSMFYDDNSVAPANSQMAQGQGNPVTPQAQATAAALQPQGQPATPQAAALAQRLSPEQWQVLANPRTPDFIKQMLIQNVAPKTPIKIGEGETLIDPRTFLPVYKGPNKEKDTPDIKNYNFYKENGGALPFDQFNRQQKKGDETPTSVAEYNYYKQSVPPGQPVMDYATFSTAKARASATNISNNVDMNSGQTYDKQLAEGLGKSHAALSNGVEASQARARDIAAMQGAVDAIQKSGGTTGSLGQNEIQSLKKTINAGAAALGLPAFDEKDISDKEFLTKFNRQIAGAQAKDAVGSRVTNFEMSNYLKANPGLDMSVTGNQRLLGIQSQIEQRNVAVGNAIRQATAQAISQGQRIDPVTVQKIITDYDEAHHVKDPVTGQDLTQSYTLPEFQKPEQGTNAALAKGHETNIGKIRKYNPQTGTLD